MVDLWLHQIGLSLLLIVLMVERAKLGPSKSGKHFISCVTAKASQLLSVELNCCFFCCFNGFAGISKCVSNSSLQVIFCFFREDLVN